MHPDKDMPGESTCTTCQFSEDFSNYWTAVLYFKAQNGSYKRVPQLGNNQFEKADGGMTVYYMQDPIYDSKQTSKVQGFKPVSVVVETSKYRLIQFLIFSIGVPHVHRQRPSQDPRRGSPLPAADLHVHGHMGDAIP